MTSFSQPASLTDTLKGYVAIVNNGRSAVQQWVDNNVRVARVGCARRGGRLAGQQCQRRRVCVNTGVQAARVGYVALTAYWTLQTK